MSGFLAAEAKLLLNTAFAFFRGKLGDFNDVYDHSIRVVVKVVKVLEKE